MGPCEERIQTNFHDLERGDWFVPVTLKGVDQHKFIESALARGAAGLIFEQGRQLPHGFEGPRIDVPNLREYIFERARQKRQRLKIDAIAIAGSAGKTSVKELLGAIVTAWRPHSTHVSFGNQNTKIALATQILRLSPSVSTAVFEVGARRTGDFQIPLSFLSPSIVALLNIGTAHVGEFGSLENLRREKLSILQAPSARNLVVCGDDELLLETARRSRRRMLCFGFGAHNDVRILGEDGPRIRLHIQGEEQLFVCPWNGSAKSLNIAAAVALSLHLDVPSSFVRKGIETFGGVARRFQVFEWEGVTAIDDAFNASPESLITGLRSVHRIAAKKNTLLVIGSLLELGDFSESIHRDVARTLAEIWGDLRQAPLALATVGDAARALGESAVELGLAKDRCIHFADAMSARSTLRLWKNSFSLVYFKGSKSVRLHRIFEVV